MTRRIVLIEDNEEISKGITKTLRSSSQYELVAEYDNCEAAVKRLNEDLPHLILMDIDLKGMSGIDGMVRIKKRLPNCLILIITLMKDSANVFRSLYAGADGYIIKNGDVSEIVSSMDQAFAGGAPMSLPIARMVVQSFGRGSDSPLSVRETEVLQKVSQGKSYTKIATDLFLSKDTVRSHIKHIYQKLAVNTKADALRLASNKRWISAQW